MSRPVRGPGAHIDADTVIGELRLLRGGGVRCALLVEGASDVRFWEPHVVEGVELVLCGGRAALLEAQGRAVTRALGWVWAAADADCDRLEGRLALIERLAYTDAHDLEVTLASLVGLERLLRVHADRDRLRAFIGGPPAAVAAVCAAADALGRLRWCARRAQPAPPMDWLKPLRFFDAGALTLDLPALYAEAAAQGLGADAAAVAAAVAALPAADPWQVMQGHDLVALLSGALRGALGGKGPGRDAGDVERALMMGVDVAALRGSAMGQALSGPGSPLGEVGAGGA